MTRLPVTTTNDDSLRRSIYLSGGIHFLVLLFLYFGLPVFMKPLPKPYIPIPIDIVDISDITNTRVKEQEETPKPPEPQPKPEQKTVQQYTPPTPPTPPQPEPPKPQEQAQTQTEALLPKKPVEKPQPPPPKPAEKPQQDMLASVLKNVKKMKPEEKAPDTPTPAKTQTQAQPKSIAPSLSDRLTVSEEDALRRQIENCWNPPIGARDADKLRVDVLITVNPDRTVQDAQIVDKSRAASDPYFRAAAEAAIRAVFNPKCSPLEVPDGKYEQWKSISFTFDPRDML